MFCGIFLCPLAALRLFCRDQNPVFVIAVCQYPRTNSVKTRTRKLADKISLLSLWYPLRGGRRSFGNGLVVRRQRCVCVTEGLTVEYFSRKWQANQ